MNRKIYNDLEHLIEKEGKSKGTYREYFANVRYMEKYFNYKSFKDITPSELQNYLEYLDKEYSKTTYNNHVAAIRYLYKKVLKKKNMLEILNLKRIRKKESRICIRKNYLYQFLQYQF